MSTNENSNTNASPATTPTSLGAVAASTIGMGVAGIPASTGDASVYSPVSARRKSIFHTRALSVYGSARESEERVECAKLLIFRMGGQMGGRRRTSFDIIISGHIPDILYVVLELSENGATSSSCVCRVSSIFLVI